MTVSVFAALRRSRRRLRFLLRLLLAFFLLVVVLEEQKRKHAEDTADANPDGFTLKKIQFKNVCCKSSAQKHRPQPYSPAIFSRRVFHLI